MICSPIFSTNIFQFCSSEKKNLIGPKNFFEWSKKILQNIRKNWYAVQVLLIWRMRCLRHELSHCCFFKFWLFFFRKIINFTTVPNLILPLILNQSSNLQGVRDPTKNQVAPLTFWSNVNASPLRCVIWWTSCTMRTILYMLWPKGSFTNYVDKFFAFLSPT